MQVVSCGNGPVLCLAGAGSGKRGHDLSSSTFIFVWSLFQKRLFPVGLTKEDLYKLKSWLGKRLGFISRNNRVD